MAKPIYIDSNEVEKIIAEIKEQILNAKCCGSIDIKRNLTQDKRKAVIYFTADAWNKMTALIREFETEVQWHGCVRRLSENEFEIYDILVFPHVVSGSEVKSDPARYTEWINSLDDETFNDLRFHGHSHVNMGCSPSSVDAKYRKDIVTQLPVPQTETDEDSFYLFLILNKKGEWTGEIYDLTNNALYGTNDISIEVYSDDGLLSSFVEEAKKLAVKYVSPASTPASTVNYGTSYFGYQGLGSTYQGLNSEKNEKKKEKKNKKSGGKESASSEYRYSSLFYDDDRYDYSDPFYAEGY